MLGASGALVVPFLGANCVGAWFAGSLARRRGKMKGIMIGGIVACVVGFMLLALINADTPRYPGDLPVLPGVRRRHGDAERAGFRAERRRTAATWVRLPGACCSCARWGAPSVARWSARCWRAASDALVELGITTHIDLGEVRQRGCGAGGRDAGDAAACACRRWPARSTSPFWPARWRWGLRLVVAFGMRDLPLRTASANEPVAVGH